MHLVSVSPSLGKNLSDALSPCDRGSLKNCFVAATTGSHLSDLSCQRASPMPMLPDTSNAKAR